MTQKQLKGKAKKAWNMLMDAYKAARYGLYEEAWDDTDKAMDVFRDIIDAIMRGEVVPAPEEGGGV